VGPTRSGTFGARGLPPRRGICCRSSAVRIHFRRLGGPFFTCLSGLGDRMPSASAQLNARFTAMVPQRQLGSLQPRCTSSQRVT
jgi:hypothetical protein